MLTVAQSQSARRLESALYVVGMHGRGDVLHSRALVRQWQQAGHNVFIESSWISLWHDLIEQGLKVIHKPTPLRTQAKNARRESNGFYRGAIAGRRAVQKIWYRPEDVRRHGSVLAAMCASVGLDYAAADFRIPVKSEWRHEAALMLASWSPQKPVMIYRPPCIRPEWGGAAARNPDPLLYAELFRSLRSRFFVISIADFEQSKEWLAGPDLSAECDVCLHRGELNTEQLLGLFSLADLVLTTGGFGVIMAQAVETPCIAIMGGYEKSTSYAGGARYSPYLGIDTIKPCQCFQHNHACEKRIDMPAARQKIEQFLAEHCAI